MTTGTASAQRALACLDLTSLEDGDTDASIRALCGRAMTPAGPVAAVCIYPRFVATAKAALTGTPVRLATVANFPTGGTDIAGTLAETSQALADGADEIDVVLPLAAFAAGDVAEAEALVRAVRTAAADRTLKVILETGVLADPTLIRAAAELAVSAGADFLKTSTGKRQPAATPDAVRILCEVARDAGRPVGVKAAGGIRDLQTAASYLAIADALWGMDRVTPATFRFGASGLLTSLLADLGHGAVGSTSTTY